MEDYGFEYSDDDAQDENVDIENQYYNSKGVLPAQAARTQDSPAHCIRSTQAC